MLKIINLSKSYGINPLFDEINFTVDYGERIGLIGRNGHGKSTLLRIITGEEEADTGEVSYPKDYKIGYLEQHLNFKQKTILEVACSQMTVSEDGTDLSYKAKTILMGLGFSEMQFDQSPESLSGGYQIRLNLAKLLASEPNLLLLDEPTNYLDIVSVRWLIRFLNNWRGELILITHDQDFMNSVTTHTLGIHRSRVRKISGSTVKFRNLIAKEEELTEQTRINQLKKRQETEEFINRFRAKASKAKAVQSRIKALEKEDVIEKLSDIKSLDFKFPYQNFRGDWPLHIKNLSFGYEQDNLLIKDFSFSLKTGDRVAIIGKNGKGKSTLLNLIAGEIKTNSVEYADKSEIAFYGQTNIDRLNSEATIEEEVSSENPALSRTICRSICGTMLFSGDAAEKQIKVLSGGERARVLIAKLLVKSANLLLLDEPTNHLDMESCQALTKAIKKYQGTVVFVSHDEALLKTIANRLIVFDRGEIKTYDMGYQEFLNKVGWEDEDEIIKSDQNSSLSNAERKKLRAAIKKERQEVLKPLNRKISKLEQQIIKLEDKINQDTKKILELSGQEVAEVSKDIGMNQNEIDDLFEELEEISAKHTKLDKEFQEKIAELS